MQEEPEDDQQPVPVLNQEVLPGDQEPTEMPVEEVLPEDLDVDLVAIEEPDQEEQLVLYNQDKVDMDEDEGLVSDFDENELSEKEIEKNLISWDKE